MLLVILPILGLTGLLVYLVYRAFNVKTIETQDRFWLEHGHHTNTELVTIEGHRYIVFHGYHCGGVIHAHSCPCMVQEPKKKPTSKRKQA